MTMTTRFLDLLQIRLPILQAPMAGVSTPAMAAAVSDAGALGALGLGASDPKSARDAILRVQQLTSAPFNVNFFCHATPKRDPAQEADWIARTAPIFARFGATPPTALREIYASFRDTDDFLDLVLDLRPPVVSFHFGLPRPDQMKALRKAELVVMASATSVPEAMQLQAAGCDAIIAQGWEAGGHRGIFDPNADDARLSTLDLVKALAGQITLPVVAAGGIMTGADIWRAMTKGAAAAQLGTAFIGCNESAADGAYRDRLALGGETVMTPAISGRPARCLGNAFTEWAEDIAPSDIPAYPCAYDLAKALNGVAKAKGATAFGAQWAGANADQARSMAAADLVECLATEIADS